MKNRRALKSIGLVAASNISTLLTGIIVGFVIPKIMSITDYGYYKTYSLYIHYAVFLSFGIIDGIVLSHGEKDYGTLDRKEIRGVFQLYSFAQVFFALCLTTASFFVKSESIKFIMLMLGINLIITNTSGFFTQISQITLRFKELSFRTFLKSIASCVSSICLLLLYTTNTYSVGYKGYIIISTMIGFILMVWYINTYKDIIFGEKSVVRESVSVCFRYIKLGLPLLFANTCSNLILLIDRQFVNVAFSNEVYSVYSFAYTLLSLVSVFTSAISTVLFPTLKRSDSSVLKSKYKSLITIMSTLILGCLTVFFPMTVFINWYLPKYSESLAIFRIAFPAMAMSLPITIIIHNYYKLFNREKEFFLISIMTLVLSLALNWAAFLIFHSTISITVASFITIIIWYLAVDIKMSSLLSDLTYKPFFYTLIMVAIFLGCTFISNVYIGMIAYFALFVAVSYFMNRRVYAKFIRLFIEKK